MKSVVSHGSAIIAYAESDTIIIAENPMDGVRIGADQIAIPNNELVVTELEQELEGNYWEYEFVDGVVVPKNI